MTVPCYNSCSGRGTCVLGACQCQRGFFGLDCSLFVDRSGKTRCATPVIRWGRGSASPSQGLSEPGLVDGIPLLSNRDTLRQHL